jgi:hypothetical protein
MVRRTELTRSSADRHGTDTRIWRDRNSSWDGAAPIAELLTVRATPPVEPMTEAELRSIAFADADGWRCFYPATRGHLTAAEARAVMRAERGLPEETPEEAAAAEFLLTMENGWRDDRES